jgi:hypothetical protein
MKFTDLKNTNLTAKLRAQLAEQSEKSERKIDPRVFYLERDPDTNLGNALIRYLPSGEERSYHTWHRYNFQGPTNKWYSNRSLVSLGKKVKDPVSEMNSILWKSGDERIQKWVSTHTKRITNHVCNIFVLKSSQNPEQDNKNFIYKFGNQILGKIKDGLNPTDEYATPIDAFNLFAPDPSLSDEDRLGWIVERGDPGANFILRVSPKAQEGKDNKGRKQQFTFEKSAFDVPSNLGGGRWSDKKIEEVWENRFDLSEFYDERNYKPYDELKERLVEIMGGDDYLEIVRSEVYGTPSTKAKDDIQRETDDNTETDDDDKFEEMMEKKTKNKTKKQTKKIIEEVDDDDDDEFLKDLDAVTSKNR